MKKFLLIVLTAVLAGCLLLTACSTETTVTATQTATATATAKVKPIHLSLGDASPVGSIEWRQLEYFAKRVVDISGGQLIVDTFWGGALLSNQDSLDGIMKDTLDITPLPAGYTSSVVKDVAILGVPFCYYFKSATDVDSLVEFNSLIKDTMIKIHEPYKIRWLSVYPPSQGAFFMVKKWVKQPSDVKNVLLRTSGVYLGKLMTNWGAAPTAVLNTEAASALQKGIVEGAFTGCEPAIAMGIPENTPYVSILPYVDQIKQMYMSLASWNRLNAEQQGYLMQAIEEYVPTARGMMIEYQKGIIDKLKSLGCDVYFMTKAEADAFKGSYYQAVQDEIRAGNTDLGKHLCDLVNQFTAK